MNSIVYDSFKSILLNHNKKDYKYLLAISGGVDSMVLLDLFRQTATQFQVAHCNFQLRGADAFADEDLVRHYCGKHQIPFYSIQFNVEEFKATGNYSTEMACRILRYNWFDQIIQQNHLDYLVTAHHLNDNIETFMINLSRGTGIKGLIGMQVENNKIFRPLLHLTKEQILSYAKINNLDWHEDYTNLTDDYTRNKIRHHITPVLKEIHPKFESNFLKTLGFLNDTNNFVTNQIENIRNLLISDDTYAEIEISKLEDLNDKDFVQFHLFEKYGFINLDAIEKLKIADNSSEITSTTHRLIKNRNKLILVRIEDINKEEIIINQEKIDLDSITLELIKSDVRLENAKEIIDTKNIQFPLKIRKIKQGDYFFPIGMKGQKKMIHKFLKDLKLSKIEKEQTWLLVDNQDQIIWVINQRLDERFKINNNTKEFLNIIVC